MGNYNPYQPVILGQEWPGIRDENTQFAPAVDVVELGHSFATLQAYTLQDMRFYVRDMPANTNDEVYVGAIYPYGREAETGPIRRVVIPAETVFATGATLSSGTGENALLTPAIDSYYVLTTSPNISQVTTGFNTGAYTILGGKRIVAVNLLYCARRVFGSDVRGNGPDIYLANAPYPASAENLVYSLGDDIPEGATFGGDQTLTLPFGDVSRLWQSPVTDEVLPWNYADLLRFDGSTALANRLMVTFATGQFIQSPPNTTGFCYLWYAALEVLYCEETRLIVGGSHRGTTTRLLYGANPIPMRTLTTRAINPTLAAGQYTATLAAADQGGLESQFTGYPDLNALRELYALPTHEGVKVNVVTTVGETFTRESINVLTQLSIHASGGALPEVHAYGRIAEAPVWGSTWVDQDVYDDLTAAGTAYPQLRFYARRFGNTTSSLFVSGTGDLAGVAASIAVTGTGGFDSLPEIVDGWKEVTLTLNTPALLGGLAAPGLRWSAPTETAGNRWEVLGVIAPAVSGIAANLLNPAVQQLGVATYQPPSGVAVDMNWAAPPVSGVAQTDPRSDMVFLLSTAPPTLTGLTVNTLTQTVTGIGTGCGGATPCCIASAISYNRVTWSTASGTVSGGYLGAVELQRWDAQTDWQTILSASTPGVTGFSDYEARVGQQSVYRVRATNLYGFAGAWSTQVTGTVTSPGVTLQCDTTPGTAPGVLIFTSNAAQSGSRNLAYVMQFDRSVDESFGFPEAATVRRRRRYQRDYFTAFRPTERGGEQFTRTVLVQAAAGALPNIANMRSLRDLAWDQLPYVCVRDELGNRWFADVIVPDGSINQRTNYFATVDIQEVSSTAYAVVI